MKKLDLQLFLVFAGMLILYIPTLKAQSFMDTRAESTATCENLVSFIGKPQNNSIVLSWRTLSEYDDQYFNIQRSVDGINWDYIGKIKGTGGSLWSVTYCYLDTTVNTGLYFYRIKINDGKDYTFSNILSVNYNGQSIENSKASIYPNPTRNVIWIKTEQVLSKDNLNDISIYSANGEQVYITKMKDNLQKIDLSDYKKGFYYVKIGTQTYKIYKE